MLSTDLLNFPRDNTLVLQEKHLGHSMDRPTLVGNIMYFKKYSRACLTIMQSSRCAHGLKQHLKFKTFEAFPTNIIKGILGHLA